MTTTTYDLGTADVGEPIEQVEQPPALLPYAVAVAGVQHYGLRADIMTAAAAAVLQWWALLDRRRLDASWLRDVRPGLREVMLEGQRQAVDLTEPYFADLTAGWSQRIEMPEPLAQVDPQAFVGQTADQREIDDLLDLAIIDTKKMILAGATEDQALQVGLNTAVLQAKTEIADAGRESDGVAVVTQPVFIGEYRMLNLPSCDRCVVLAGKWYRWDAGFDRHEDCDCIGVAAIAGRPGERRIADADNYDPAGFDPMEAVRQGRVTGLTKAERTAILRDGANLNAIVNAKRGGLRTLTGGPKQRARRPTAAYIYNRAGDDREAAIRELRRWNYILPE